MTKLPPKKPRYHLNELRDNIRRRNIAAGWVKKPSVLNRLFPSLFPQKKRSAPELISLIHSEASEALEGVRKDLMDEHLPHRKMHHVEMVDILIRTLDYCGEFDIDVDTILAEKLLYNSQRSDHKPENRKKAGGKKF